MTWRGHHRCPNTAPIASGIMMAVALFVKVNGQRPEHAAPPDGAPWRTPTAAGNRNTIRPRQIDAMEQQPGDAGSEQSGGQCRMSAVPQSFPKPPTEEQFLGHWCQSHHQSHAQDHSDRTAFAEGRKNVRRDRSRELPKCRNRRRHQHERHQPDQHHPEQSKATLPPCRIRPIAQTGAGIFFVTRVAGSCHKAPTSKTPLECGDRDQDSKHPRLVPGTSAEPSNQRSIVAARPRDAAATIAPAIPARTQAIIRSSRTIVSHCAGPAGWVS